MLEFFKNIKKSLFPFYKNHHIKFIFKKLKEDFPDDQRVIMFVGGCVRKHLTNVKVDDIDMATSLTSKQIKDKLINTKYSVIDTGIEHGTVTIVSGKFKIEITTLRKDIKTDGRHAEIEYTNDWQADSERRDFTINAIYLDDKGKIFDPQQGLTDLKNKNIKFIGDPQKRIEEDYLRIIRFIRFSIEYESYYEKNTLEVLKLNLDGIKKISKERILNELLKILSLKNFLKINKDENLKEIFLLIFPELKYLNRLNNLQLIPNKEKIDVKILLSTLLVDGKDNHEYFSHKYNISNNLKENIELLSNNFQVLQKDRNFFTSNLKKNIYFYGKEHLIALNILNFSDRKKNRLKDYLITLEKIKKSEIPDFPFDGNYLKRKGMSEGLLIGNTLKSLEKEWLNNNFQISEQKVLDLIKKNLN